MAAKSGGKCTERPKRPGPMTVKVKGYTRDDGTKFILINVTHQNNSISGLTKRLVPKTNLFL